jgi:kinesin family protein 5
LKCNNKEGNTIRKSKFLFVDLAGSERIHKSGATNLKAEEAKNINQSLTTLGRCIMALKTKSMAPFRESSLTLLLKDSISGNCKTMMICTIADESTMVGESVSTCLFGLNCGKVKLKATAQ